MGLALVIGGLGLGLYVWQLTLARLVALQDMAGRLVVAERRVSGLEERLEKVEQNLEALAIALKIRLPPGP